MSKWKKIASKHIEQIVSKQNHSKSSYLNKYYLDNPPPTALFSTRFGKYNSHQSTTDQVENTNHAEMNTCHVVSHN